MSDFGYKEQRQIWEDELAIACHKYEAGRCTKISFKAAKRRIERKLASIDAALEKEKE